MAIVERINAIRAEQGLPPTNRNTVDSTMSRIRRARREGRDVSGLVAMLTGGVATAAALTPQDALASNGEDGGLPPWLVPAAIGAVGATGAGVLAARNRLRLKEPTHPPGWRPSIPPLARDDSAAAWMARDQKNRPVVRMGMGPEEYEFGVIDRPDSMSVDYPELPPEAQGKGLGVLAYRAVADEAARQGKSLQSSSALSRSGRRMYDALGRRGYDVRELQPEALQPENFGRDTRGFFGSDNRGAQPLMEIPPSSGRISLAEEANSPSPLPMDEASRGQGDLLASTAGALALPAAGAAGLGLWAWNEAEAAEGGPDFRTAPEWEDYYAENPGLPVDIMNDGGQWVGPRRSHPLPDGSIEHIQARMIGDGMRTVTIRRLQRPDGSMTPPVASNLYDPEGIGLPEIAERARARAAEPAPRRGLELAVPAAEIALGFAGGRFGRRMNRAHPMVGQVTGGVIGGAAPGLAYGATTPEPDMVEGGVLGGIIGGATTAAGSGARQAARGAPDIFREAFPSREARNRLRPQDPRARAPADPAELGRARAIRERFVLDDPDRPLELGPDRAVRGKTLQNRMEVPDGKRGGPRTHMNAWNAREIRLAARLADVEVGSNAKKAVPQIEAKLRENPDLWQTFRRYGLGIGAGLALGEASLGEDDPD